MTLIRCLFDHANGLCTMSPSITKSLDDIGEEIRGWVDGEENPLLDDWYGEHKESISKININAAKEERNKVKLTENIKANMSIEDEKAIEEILNNAPDDVKKLWNKIEDKLTTVDAYSKDSYYRHEEGVSVNLINDIVDKKGKSQYTTFMHEYGHHIDAVFGFDDIYKQKTKLGRKTVEIDVNTWSYASKKIGLSDSLRKELNQTIKRLKVDTTSELTDKLLIHAEKHYPKGYNGVSDIISGLTNDMHNMGYHHSRNYWKKSSKTDGLGKEAFAHMFQSHAMQGDSDKFMKEVFPKSYNLVLDFIKEASK